MWILEIELRLSGLVTRTSLIVLLLPVGSIDGTQVPVLAKKII